MYPYTCTSHVLCNGAQIKQLWLSVDILCCTLEALMPTEGLFIILIIVIIIILKFINRLDSAQKNMPQLIPKMLRKGYSSVLHCTSHIAHKNHIIREMSMGTVREHGIVFQSMDQVKRYNGLWLLKKYGDLYHFCIILVYNLSPLNWEN